MAFNRWHPYVAVTVLACTVWANPVRGVEPEQAKTDGDASLVSLTFPEQVQLNVLLEYVGKRLGINILYDEQLVSRQVTVKAPVQVPVESLPGLLDSILRMNQLALVDAEQPGWKRVVVADNLPAIAPPVLGPDDVADQRGSTVMSRLFPLRHAGAARVNQFIQPFLTQPGAKSFSIDEHNLVIVTDYTSNVERIAGLIELLDQPPEQVEVAFLPVLNHEAAKVADRAAAIMQFKALGRRGQAAAAAPDLTSKALELLHDERSNQVIAVGRPELVDEARKIVKALDIALGLQTKVYEFRVVEPQMIDELTRELLGESEAERHYRAVAYEARRQLVVSATSEVHDQIEWLRRQLDVAPLESPIRFYKLQNTSAQDVLATLGALESDARIIDTRADQGDGAAPKRQAPSLPSPGETQPTSPSSFMKSAAALDHSGAAQPPSGSIMVRSERATMTADPNTNSIIIEARPEVQNIYEKLIQKLDQRRPQVLIEAVVVVLDTSNHFSLGVELGHKGSIDGRDTLVFSSFGLSQLNPTTGALSLIPGVGFNGAVIDTDIANIIIRALARERRAKVVSAPRILVNDNAQGLLESISEEPFISVNASDTVATTSFNGYVSAGTSIAVRPHISEGDHLTLEYEVTLNSFSGSGSNGIPPPRQTNAIVSHVTVPDGHTIVVGGLNRTDMSREIDAIPLLGEIPLLKHLFRSRIDENSESTLFVFIRPTILRDDQFADLKFLSQRQLTHAELPSDYPMSEPLVIE